ncbi:restriction endonuclease subunit S [Limnohabitans sp.]|uniref:restriction endonuclease subunit S n=1 Tax=Limnohabitans sp. TaxID=1907725 RepID=UPI0035B2DDD2
MSWQTRPLSEIADFVLGKMLDQAKNRGEPLPYLANVNVRWGDFDLSDLREMRFEPHEVERYGLKPGDIVMCEGGEPGRCALWKGQRDGMMIQKALHRIRPHAGLDSTFLYYAFLNIGKQNGFAPFFTGATIKHLPREQLARVPIRFPEWPEQKAIAVVLANYDDLIATNQRRMALLEDAARRLYREWFVHLRFPGHESVVVNDGVPERWRKQTLASVADVNARSIGARDRPDSVLYIDISTVSTGLIGEVTPYAFADAPGRARRRVVHGDVIWSCVRPNRRSYALIWEPDERLVASTGFAVLSATGVPFSYLYFTTTTDTFVGHLEQNATGAAYPAVTAKTFEDAEILVPDGDTLAAFDHSVLPQLEQTEFLKQQNRALAQARDLLLPKLMSGQLDVSGIRLPEEATA